MVLCLFSSQVLQVGKELLACLTTFKDFGSCKVGKSSLEAIYSRALFRTEEVGPHGRYERESGSNGLLNDFEWRKKPPLLCCWQTLFQSFDYKQGFSDYALECLSALSLGSLSFCVDGNRLVLMPWKLNNNKVLLCFPVLIPSVLLSDFL